jgi:phage gp46-like protein
MADVRIVSRADLKQTVSDWLLLKSGTLDESQELANYVKVALMTDRLSDLDEVRPDPDSDDRRGWWGDMDAQEIWSGWPIGTKNWLLTRAKIVDSAAWEGATVARAENYTREALQPLIDLNMCSSIDVVATQTDTSEIVVQVVIYRGNLPEIELTFQNLWQEIGPAWPPSEFGFGP